MKWESEFLPHMRDRWQPGQHLAIISPTGTGKTTFAVPLLRRCRRFVLAVDPKGGDETLAALRFERLAKWPGERAMTKRIERNRERGVPSRYIVGPVVRLEADQPALRRAVADALRGAFNMGGWTIYVDELQILADRRMMNLSDSAARLLIAARNKGVSFVSSFQAPSWVPTEATRQVSWVAISQTMDVDVVNRLAEIMGRDKAYMRGAIGELPEYHWLVGTRRPRDPLIMTKPPYLAPVAPK